MSEKIVNRVAQSGIITLDLSHYIPDIERAVLDIKDFLFRNLILKEKDFRDQVRDHHWEKYANKAVAVHCSTDSIIPHWAYMLVAAHLQPHAALVVYGTRETLNAVIAQQAISKLDLAQFKDQRVVVKGCGDEKVDAAAYLEVTQLLRPVVKSLMYGEPCSTVPIYKMTK